MLSAVAFTGPRFTVPGVGYHNAIPGVKPGGPYSGLSGRFSIETADLAPPNARREAWTTGVAGGAGNPEMKKLFISYMSILKDQNESLIRARAQLAQLTAPYM